MWLDVISVSTPEKVSRETRKKSVASLTHESFTEQTFFHVNGEINATPT